MSYWTVSRVRDVMVAQLEGGAVCVCSAKIAPGSLERMFPEPSGGCSDTASRLLLQGAGVSPPSDLCL